MTEDIIDEVENDDNEYVDSTLEDFSIDEDDF